MAKYTSGRVKKFPQSGITSDRYEFLGLEQAEPDLGSPIVGVSSIGANPHPSLVEGNHYVLVSVSDEVGSRYWVDPVDLITDDIRVVDDTSTDETWYVAISSVTTGIQSRISVSSNKLQINPSTGALGIGTKIDIVPYDSLNSGTLSFEASAGQLFSITNNLTTGSIFSVNDVSGIPSIDVDANGTIQLAPYGSSEYIGIGTTNPTSKLHVIGNTLVTGVSTFTGPVSFGTSAYFGDNDTLYFGDGNDLQIYHSGSENFIFGSGVSGGIALQSSRVRIIDNGSVLLADFTSSAANLYFSGSKKLSTIGYGATVFGVLQSQGLQVTGDAYVSGNLGIGTTNPTSKLTVDGATEIKSGIDSGFKFDPDSTQIEIHTKDFQNNRRRWLTFPFKPYEHINSGLSTDGSALITELDWLIQNYQGGTSSGIGTWTDNTSYWGSLTSAYGFNPDTDIILHNRLFVGGRHPRANEDYETGLWIAPGGVTGSGNTSSAGITTVVNTDFGGGATEGALSAKIRLSGYVRGASSDKLEYAAINFDSQTHPYNANFNRGKAKIWARNELNYNFQQYGSSLIFGTSQKGPASAEQTYYDRMIIDDNGNVGIGTLIPTTRLTVDGDVTATVFTALSDKDLKKNIKLIENPIEKISNLNGVYFDWIENEEPSIGLIAQEVEKVFPELVNGTEFKSINYNGLIGVLVECIKDLQSQIDSLKNP